MIRVVEREWIKIFFTILALNLCKGSMGTARTQTELVKKRKAEGGGFISFFSLTGRMPLHTRPASGHTNTQHAILYARYSIQILTRLTFKD